MRYLPHLLAVALPMIAGNAIAGVFDETQQSSLLVAQQDGADTKPDGGKPKPPEGEEEPDC